jgi:hypothetical protein
MDGMPEKGSPDFWREMHSIPPNDFDRGYFPQTAFTVWTAFTTSKA